MQAETWKRVEELFEAAVAEPPESREQFLQIACPDDAELRAEVLTLLNSGDSAGTFLEDSPLGSARKRPPLARGHKLGHFDVLELIGRGGMGDVYRARDTRLKREVAIKVLPAEFARDPVGILRFEREARSASALNHRNILCIYEIGHEGQQYWIVSELVQGQLLREIMKGRALPARRAVEIGVQIAEGLAAAHAAGIVHRDLNPGNVMVTSEGRVKILDFGLAKRVRAASDTGTSTAELLTTPGLIMGTPGYMAPEQITGNAADHRSDIFALGVILHEMFSGTRAFRGDSMIEVLNANLKSDPAPLPSSVPSALQRITLRCLEKEPSNRFQSAADVGFALAALSDAIVGVPVARPNTATWPKWAMLALVAGIVVAGVDFGIRLMQSHNVHETSAVLTRLTTDSGLTTDGAISSDGKLVAFASDRAGAGNLDIWVKQIGSGGPPVRLTADAADDYDPTFSPDGTRIAFRSERSGGGIYEIPTFGGEPRLFVFQGRHPRFSPNGQFLMYWTGMGSRGTPSGHNPQLFVQSILGGSPVQVGASCSEIDSTAVWSPDSQRVLFEGLCHAQRAVWIFSINGNSLQPSKELYEYLSSNSFLVFASGVEHPAFVFHDWLGQPSRLLLSGFIGGAVSIADAVSIASVPISEDGMRVTGERKNLTFGTEPEYRASEASSSGRVVLSSVRTSSQVWSLPIDEAGKTMGEPAQLTVEAWSGAPSLSRDGEMLAYQSRRGEGWEIYSMRVRSGKQISVAAGAGRTYEQIINWTGTSIVYVLGQEPRFSLWQVASSGGLPQKLLDQFFYPTDWSPDSRFLIGLADRPNRGQIKILDLQTRTETTVLADSRRELYQAHLSSDGNWMTFNAILGSHSQLYVAPFRRALVSQSEWIPITDGSAWDDKPHFSRRDKLLFFTSDRDGYRCIWAQPLRPNMRPFGKAFPVYHFHQSRLSIGNLGVGTLELAVGPKALMFNQQEFTGNLWLLDPNNK